MRQPFLFTTRLTGLPLGISGDPMGGYCPTGRLISKQSIPVIDHAIRKLATATPVGKTLSLTTDLVLTCTLFGSQQRLQGDSSCRLGSSIYTSECERRSARIDTHSCSYPFTALNVVNLTPLMPIGMPMRAQ